MSGEQTQEQQAPEEQHTESADHQTEPNSESQVTPPKKEATKIRAEDSSRQEEQTQSKESMQVVILTLIGEYFGLSIEYITEIIKATEITAIPNAPDYIEGAINLRGKIIIIVDLAKKLSVSKKSDSKDTRIIVVEIDDEWIGLRVDSVTETIIIDKAKVHDPPSLIKEKIGDEHIVGVTRFNNETLLTIIDPYKILEK
ncbi:MAG: chemotaxis protein CheW [Nanobdellota archaeon]